MVSFETFPNLRDLKISIPLKVKVFIKDIPSPSPHVHNQCNQHLEQQFVQAKSRKVVQFGLTCQKHLIQGADFLNIGFRKIVTKRAYFYGGVGVKQYW